MFNFLSKKISRTVRTQSYVDKVRFTPDLSNLQQYKLHPLFVYDELMVGHPQHDLLKDSLRVSHAAYTVGSFTMLKKIAGKETYPLPFVARPVEAIKDISPAPVSFRTPAAKIRGELYMVQPSDFLDIDNHKVNGIYFERKKIRVVVPYSESFSDKDGNNMEAFDHKQISVLAKTWMYIARPQFWDPLIDGFDYSPVRTYVTRVPTNIGEVYHFSEREYDT